MLMPNHFLDIYAQHFYPINQERWEVEREPCPHIEADTTYKKIKEYVDISEEEWRPYWNNIVDVFSNVYSHREHFNMKHWHCGSSHCLAGWAQYMFNRKNYYLWLRYDNVDPFIDGEKLLSPVISSFFWFTDSTDEIYNYLILPVIKEARKDGMISIKKVEPVSIHKVACVAQP